MKLCYRRWHSDPSLADRAGHTSLHQACVSGNVHAVRLLLWKGCDANRPDFHGWTPLFHSTSPEMIDLLVLNGARVGTRAHLGWMAHHLHISYGRLSIVETLMNQGANMHALTSAGNNGLNMAIRYGENEICALLLRLESPKKV